MFFNFRKLINRMRFQIYCWPQIIYWRDSRSFEDFFLPPIVVVPYTSTPAVSFCYCRLYPWRVSYSLLQGLGNSFPRAVSSQTNNRTEHALPNSNSGHKTTLELDWLWHRSIPRLFSAIELQYIGTLEPLSCNTLEHWSLWAAIHWNIGAFELQHIGTLEPLSCNTLEHWSLWAATHWNIGAFELQHIGTLEPLSCNTLEHWSLWAATHWNIGAFKLQHIGTLEPSSCNTLEHWSLRAATHWNIGAFELQHIGTLEPSSCNTLEHWSLLVLKVFMNGPIVPEFCKEKKQTFLIMNFKSFFPHFWRIFFWCFLHCRYSTLRMDSKYSCRLLPFLFGANIGWSHHLGSYKKLLMWVLSEI